MTRDQFVSQMKTLVSIFGDSEYSPERMKLIFDAVKDLPEKNFAFMVKHFCKSKSVKYPPLPSEFEEAAIEQRKRLFEFKAIDTYQAMEDRGPEKLKEIVSKFDETNLIYFKRFTNKSNPEGA